MKPTQTEIDVALRYISERKTVVGGVNIPESMEEFAQRTGLPMPTNTELATDYALVQTYPHSFEKNYLKNKWG